MGKIYSGPYQQNQVGNYENGKIYSGPYQQNQVGNYGNGKIYSGPYQQNQVGNYDGPDAGGAAAGAWFFLL